LEQAGKPRPSPFVIVFGSFDAFVESIHAGYVNGAYDKQDIADVIAALRAWEGNGTWAMARSAGSAPVCTVARSSSTTPCAETRLAAWQARRWCKLAGIR